jgi:hypothetical protein
MSTWTWVTYPETDSQSSQSSAGTEQPEGTASSRPQQGSSADTSQQWSADPSQQPTTEPQGSGTGDHSSASGGGGQQSGESTGTGGFSDSLHALGQTIGLNVGGDHTLIGDAAATPDNVHDGESAGPALGNLVSDVGQTVSASGDVVQALGADIGSQTLSFGHLIGGSGGGESGGGDLASVELGTPGDASIVNAGLLDASPSEAPVSVAVGNGDILPFATSDGSGADALTGLLSAFDGATTAGTAYGDASDQGSEGMYCDGSALIQVDDHQPTALVALDGHAVI